MSTEYKWIDYYTEFAKKLMDFKSDHKALVNERI